MKIRIQHYTDKSPPEKQNPGDGRKCFSTIHFGNKPSPDREDIEELELETKILSNNQLNTTEKRVFDWYHSRFNVKSGTPYYGHWILPEDFAVVNEMRRKRHVCGYCGYQTDTPEATDFWCRECLGNIYLKEEELHLLRLIPVIESRKSYTKGIPDELKQNYQLQKELYASKQGERLKERRTAYIKRRAEERVKHDIKTKIITRIYDAGLDHQKLGVVYYTHTDTLIFGAISKLTDADVKDIESKMEGVELGCPWSIGRN
jgi:hypothetical protein